MKKILFALCAMATLASCSNDEIVNFDKEAIAFDGAFVDNGTRAADNFTIKTDSLKDFAVWATTQRPEQEGVAQPVPIMQEVIVSRTSPTTWAYGTEFTQYWIPGNTYQFVAAKNYGGVTLTNGVPSQFTYDAASQADLLYAASAPRVGEEAGANAPVAFTFDHLLTKAYFSVDTNQMSGANKKYTYRVSDLRITNAVKKATYTVGATTPWAPDATTYTEDFGHINGANYLEADKTYTSDFARLLIPANYTDLNIACTIETLYGDSVIDVQDYDKTISQEFVKGYVYNFVLALKDPGQPIEFTVTKVNEWVKAGDANGNTAIPGL